MHRCRALHRNLHWNTMDERKTSDPGGCKQSEPCGGWRLAGDGQNIACRDTCCTGEYGGRTGRERGWGKEEADGSDFCGHRTLLAMKVDGCQFTGLRPEIAKLPAAAKAINRRRTGLARPKKTGTCNFSQVPAGTILRTGHPAGSRYFLPFSRPFRNSPIACPASSGLILSILC